MINIDMPMPARCFECPFRQIKRYSTEQRCIADHQRIITTPVTQKPDWCPLKETDK